MKLFLLKLSLVLICSVLPLLSQAKVVTLVVNSIKTTDSITIGTNEVGRIVTYPTYPVGAQDGTSALFVTVGGITNALLLNVVNGGLGISSGNSFVVAGPATIELRNRLSTTPSFCTIEVNPESFPADKTLIIPADTKGANIIMESSSDLIHWTNSVPGKLRLCQLRWCRW